jgi:hypothetical protein
MFHSFYLLILDNQMKRDVLKYMRSSNNYENNIFFQIALLYI